MFRGPPTTPGVATKPPRAPETPAGLRNSIGVQNPGVDAVVEKYASTWASGDVPVIVNVAGESIADYVEVALRREGVPGIAGIVLTSSVTRDTNKGNKDKVPDVDLGAIRVPVLFVHNQDDACYVCVPDDIPDLEKKFTAPPSVRTGAGRQGERDGVSYQGQFWAFDIQLAEKN